MPTNVHAPLAAQQASPHRLVGAQELPMPCPEDPLGHAPVPVIVHAPVVPLQQACPGHGFVVQVVFTPAKVLSTPSHAPPR